MKLSGKTEDVTSNEPLNFGSDSWPWRRFVLSECALRAKIYALRVHSPNEDLRSPSASSYYRYCYYHPEENFLKVLFSVAYVILF